MPACVHRACHQLTTPCPLPPAQQVPKFKIDAEKWTAPYVPYAWGWWERFMLKK